MGTIITVLVIATACIIFGFIILTPFLLLGGVIKRWKLRNRLLELELQDKLREKSRDEELISLLEGVEKKEVKDEYVGRKVLSLVTKEN